jgi:hypothetical protein
MSLALARFATGFTGLAGFWSTSSCRFLRVLQVASPLHNPVPRHRSLETQAPLTQAHVPLLPDDQVVQHFDIEQRARFDKLARYRYVLMVYMENPFDLATSLDKVREHW